MNILFIEDDAIETMKLHRAVKKLNCNHNIAEAKNGEEALEYLNSYQVKPDIILLDLNMPRMSGIDFLKILKADEVLKYLPTIVLTTSENRIDLLECYKIGIAGYVVKPLRYADYEENLDKIFKYWEINSLVKP
ncbi:response regulator [Saccharicrinis aurantiacus]|uniref:response regulator n=1 Tax=Saccharicrinis aurantiacus TaxID=1849719 RepID=UPI00094F8BA0|nr:response regulator [Saccharicrinis aurantiacus]